jgi:hypothetical protein
MNGAVWAVGLKNALNLGRSRSSLKGGTLYDFESGVGGQILIDYFNRR